METVKTHFSHEENTIETDQKECPSCKHLNPAQNYFCTQCGSRLYGDSKKRSRLVIIHGEPKEATFLLGRKRNTIGRDGGNVIVLADKQISNKHALITFEENNYWVKDLYSKNGVYLNGKKITKTERLFNGCIIELGTTILRFESEE